MTTPPAPTAPGFRPAWDAAAPPLSLGLDRGEVEGPWLAIPPAAVAGLPAGAAGFFAAGGWPADAAPFLAFRARFTRLSDRPHRLTDPAPLRELWAWGSDGAGDPVCVVGGSAGGGGTAGCPAGAVVRVDHERLATGRLRAVFVNADVPRFAACLLAYRRAVTATARAGRSLIDDGLAPIVAARLRADLTAADPPALAPGTFWTMAVEETEGPGDDDDVEID